MPKKRGVGTVGKNAAERGARWETGMAAVYLIGCALHDAAPDLRQIGDLDPLLRYCGQHSVTAMVAMALESAWKVSPPEDPAVMTPWKQAKDKAIRKNILLNAERARILAYLDSIGCWYLPLKGSFLQFDYPKFGMRQMSDNDILIDASMSLRVRDFMENSGYKAEMIGKIHHDEYLKEPVYNFEMHRSLFRPQFNERIAKYYENIRDIMEKDEGNRCGYHLKPEDFYVYMTAHAYKHYADHGTGIRTLVDSYVFLNRHRALDWPYVERELETLGILEYERKSRSLSMKLWGEPRGDIGLTDGEAEFLAAFLGAGTYGNRLRRTENALDRMAETERSGGFLLKLRYLWNRVFPPLELMAETSPELKEKPWLLPFLQIKRLFLSLVKKPKILFAELMTLVKYKKSQKEE